MNRRFGGFNVLTEALSLLDGNSPTTIRGQIHILRLKIFGILTLPEETCFITYPEDAPNPAISRWFLVHKIDIIILKELIGTKRQVFEEIIKFFDK